MFKVRLRSSIVLMAVTIFLMVTGGDILFAGPTGDGSMQELTAICSGSKLRTNHSTEKFILPASSMIFTPGWNVSAAFSVAVTKPVQE